MYGLIRITYVFAPMKAKNQTEKQIKKDKRQHDLIYTITYPDINQLFKQCAFQLLQR